MAVTAHTRATDTLAGDISGWLKTAQTTWNVEIVNITSAEEMAQFLPGLRSPGAVVAYAGSDWNTSPDRRRVRFTVYLKAMSSKLSTSGSSIRAMVDACVSAVDDQVAGDAHFQAADDSVLDVGPNNSVAVVNFVIKDY
jgi:hypothetical protein